MLETELRELDAFRAIFSFQQTFDGLSVTEVPNLGHRNPVERDAANRCLRTA
jgi:hypothetical protein